MVGDSTWPKWDTWKNENFQIKNSDIFHIFAQNIDCGYLLELSQCGGSSEYQQSMFWAEIRKNNVYSCKPQFYYTKMGLWGSKLYKYVFVIGDNLYEMSYPVFREI